jgi:hypothetical protein
MKNVLSQRYQCRKIWGLRRPCSSTPSTNIPSGVALARKRKRTRTRLTLSLNVPLTIFVPRCESGMFTCIAFRTVPLPGYPAGSVANRRLRHG